MWQLICATGDPQNAGFRSYLRPRKLQAQLIIKVNLFCIFFTRVFNPTSSKHCSVCCLFLTAFFRWYRILEERFRGAGADQTLLLLVQS